jgi:hypothetical protein
MTCGIQFSVHIVTLYIAEGPGLHYEAMKKLKPDFVKYKLIHTKKGGGVLASE